MEFSSKYHESRFPERYASKHRASLSRRLNDWRERQLLGRCLSSIDVPDSIADIGCGPGRFWPVLHDYPAADLFALDVSEAMLSFARERHPEAVGERFQLTAGSVTALPFRDGAFDCVVSMRLLHHFGTAGDRRLAMSELGRIARRHLIVSLWTDGNYKAWRRQRLERRRGRRSYQNRFIVGQSELAEDFAAAGLRILAHHDLVPGYSQWRYYILEHDGSEPGVSATGRGTAPVQGSAANRR